MSKDLNSNERFLKELASGYKPEPPQKAWEEIEQVLDKKKSKRRVLPFLLLLGALFVAGAIFFNLSGKQGKAFSRVEQEKSMFDYNRMEEDLQNSNIADTTGLNTTHIEPQGTITETSNNENQQQSTTKLQNVKAVDSEASDGLKQRPNTNILEVIPSVIQNQAKKNVDAEERKSIETSSYQSATLDSFSDDRSSNATIKANNSTLIAIVNEEEISKSKASAQSPAFTAEDRGIMEASFIQRSKFLLKPLNTGIPLPELRANLISSLSDESKVKESVAKPWFVELGGGIGKDMSNPALMDPAQGEFRLNTESKWYSWSTSLQVGYQFTNNVYASMGFDLNQTKKKFDYLRRDVSILLIDARQSPQVSNGDFFSVGEIRYNLADADLSLGKRFILKKWRFSIEGGAIFNMLFTAKGKLQTGGFEFSRLEEQERYYRNRVGLGAHASAMFDYPLSDYMWISVGPSYHQYFNTLSSVENPLEERNAILQVKTRVRRYF